MAILFVFFPTFDHSAFWFCLSFAATPAITADIPLIDRKRLILGGRLGSGAFGDVNLGFLDDGNDERNKVAIKSLR